ncbi:MAG TPA: hypothetical protein V6D12_07285 [Candidatus Obscuribacterales bacterium]
MPTINAKSLTLNDVHRLLNLQQQSSNGSFTNLLSLEPLTEFEQQELLQICNDFLRYLSAGKVSDPPTYEILPDLILTDTERSIQLLQILKAICNLQNVVSPS